MRHDDRLVVERDVVVRVLPARRRGRGAALGVRRRIVRQRVDQSLFHFRIVDQELAVVVDQLHVVGVHEREERVERVARVHPHRETRGVIASPRLLAKTRLDLVAPERPVLLPCRGNVRLLEAGFREHVDPVLDVHRLLLKRKGVVRAFLRLVIIEIRRLDRVGKELRFHRREYIAQILELAVESPFACHLEVVDVREGDIRHGACVERRYRLRNHVLHRILRELDLDLGLVLEFLDGGEERVVFGFVETLNPPDGQRFLCECLAPERDSASGEHTGKELVHRSISSVE